MAWFRQRPRLTTPPGSPAWSSPLPLARLAHHSTPAVVPQEQHDRLAAFCAFASGVTTLLAIAVNWREVRAYPAAFYFLVYAYRFVCPFLWAGTIAFGFGSSSRILRALASGTAGYVAMAYLWPLFAGNAIPFTSARLFYGVMATVGAILWWRRRDQAQL